MPPWLPWLSNAIALAAIQDLSSELDLAGLTDPVSALQTRLGPSDAGSHKVGTWVHLVRHAVRGGKPYAAMKAGKRLLKEDYSNLPPPKWKTEPPHKKSHMACTKKGLEMAEHSGKVLRKKIPLKNLTLYTDSTDRCTKSAESLLRGLLSNSSLDLLAPPARVRVKIQPELVSAFLPHNAKPISQMPPYKVVGPARKRKLEGLRMPMGVGTVAKPNLKRWKEVLRELESLIGTGKKGHLEDLFPVPKRPALELMKNFACDMIYAFASGVEYTNATVEQRYAWIQWHHFFREADQVQMFEVPRYACLFWKVLDDLQRDGNSIYVGHDTELELLGDFLQVVWEVPPFRDLNPVPPGTGLHLHRIGDMLEVYVSNAAWGAHGAPKITFEPTKPGRVKLKKLKKRMRKALRKWAGSLGSLSKKCTNLPAFTNFTHISDEDSLFGLYR